MRGFAPWDRAGALRDPGAGVTLVEMLVAMSLVAMLVVAGTQLMAGMLEAERAVAQDLALQPEAHRALENVADAIASTSQVLVPNGRSRSRNLLVVSANVDDDFDGRIDEDPGAALFGLGPGVPGVDDDNDGLTDESLAGDDDEDGVADEDRRDGIDNDDDGSIDEDPGADANADLFPGVRRMDDDGDGLVDEGPIDDDDEDGRTDEDGPDLHIFYLTASERRLYEQRPGAAAFVLLDDVLDFEVRYLTGAGGEPLVEIRLRVVSSTGQEERTLITRVYPANQVAKHGLTSS